MSSETKIKLDVAKLKERLTPIQYDVTQCAATEYPGTGQYTDHFEEGTYVCICCATPLFTSDTKFKAHCGWPSFWAPINDEVVEEKPDRTHGMVRIETVCRKCDAHLGHVFNDGPKPTGLRYCINSASLDFVPPA